MIANVVAKRSDLPAALVEILLRPGPTRQSTQTQDPGSCHAATAADDHDDESLSFSKSKRAFSDCTIICIVPTYHSIDQS